MSVACLTRGPVLAHIRTTGFRIPGTAAEAMMAVRMMQSGAVCTLSSFVGECVSYGMTETFRILSDDTG